MRYKLGFSALVAAFIMVLPVLLARPARAVQSSPGTTVSHNNALYLITSDGKKRLYPSEQIFLSYGFNSMDQVQPASSEDMALPDGDPMPPQDGTVVCSSRLVDLGTCYLITDFKKAPFVSEQALKTAGYSLTNALTEDVTYLATDKPIVTGQEVHRYGTLVNKAGTISFVGKNGLLAFPDVATFNSWGYNFADALPANPADSGAATKLLMESRFGSELRPFEPTIPAPLELNNEDKFIIPFTDQNYTITESWLYSPQERSIHGNTNHGGIDFANPRGTPVYAAADGYAISSTHLSVLAKTYQDKSIGFGLGEFVQIWHPKQGVYTSYSHLNEVAENIPYYKPECDEHGFCDPKVVYHDPSYIKRKGKFIKQGELIGYVGDSGLSWGYEEQPRVLRYVEQKKSWDETHLHFEMYTRDNINFFKARRYDPFGIYGRVGQYSKKSYSTPESLWKLDENNDAVFIK